MWWFANVLYNQDGWQPYPSNVGILTALTGDDSDYIFRDFFPSIDFLDLGFPFPVREIEIRAKHNISFPTSVGIAISFCDASGNVLHSHTIDVSSFTDWTTVQYTAPVSWERLLIDASAVVRPVGSQIYISLLRARQVDSVGYRTLIGVGI